MRTQTRSLKPGEPIPGGRPNRYRTNQGYIRWRWLVGPGRYIECFEHRVIMGNPIGVVHHKNHVRDDNRPENLEVMSHSAHSRMHHPRKLHKSTAVKAYVEWGWQSTDIARVFGVATSQVSDRLAEAGVLIRQHGAWKRVDVDEEAVRVRHMAGCRAPKIAADLGVTPIVIRRVIRELGLTPHPVGRSRQFDTSYGAPEATTRP